VTILVNEGSGSGSELFSAVMQESGRASVVGRQSCGCVLGISRFKKLKGGSELAVSELKYVSPQGRKIEGTGVTPNRVVALTLSDLQHHRDAALEAAEKALKESRPSITGSSIRLTGKRTHSAHVTRARQPGALKPA
jgi:carboxyl-terminal processing protease